MYPYKYVSSGPVYRTSSNMGTISSSSPYNTTYGSNDDRFFLAPFVVGGLAGTALGYGIANNNQLNRPCCGYYPYPMAMPYYPNYPIYNNTNFYG